MTPPPVDAEARAAIERAARASYGRLLAAVALRQPDIAAAEDALAEAFRAALERWPAEGVPEQPEGWILTVARRRSSDGRRHRGVQARHTQTLTDVLDDLRPEPGTAFPDERLRLLFVCTHPAIDPKAQVPLMLQTVLGLDAAAIGSALRVAPKTMGQRLWRAKTKIRDAAIPFAVPEAAEWPARVEQVLEAIYGAYGSAWDGLGGDQTTARGLASEALFLAQLVVELMPDEPEALGLLALLRFAEARNAARRDADGRYVPLAEQTIARWDRTQIAQAEACLARAVTAKRLGPFQLEAAIQSAHVASVFTGRIDHPALLRLYDALLTLAPSLGAEVARAAARLDGLGPEAALAALDAIEPAQRQTYQPWWAVRAAALAALDRAEEADRAYQQAIGLSEDDATRTFLQTRREALALVPPARK